MAVRSGPLPGRGEPGGRSWRTATLARSNWQARCDAQGRVLRRCDGRAAPASQTTLIPGAVHRWPGRALPPAAPPRPGRSAVGAVRVTVPARSAHAAHVPASRFRASLPRTSAFSGEGRNLPVSAGQAPTREGGSSGKALRALHLCGPAAVDASSLQRKVSRPRPTQQERRAGQPFPHSWDARPPRWANTRVASVTDSIPTPGT